MAPEPSARLLGATVANAAQTDRPAWMRFCTGDSSWRTAHCSAPPCRSAVPRAADLRAAPALVSLGRRPPGAPPARRRSTGLLIYPADSPPGSIHGAVMAIASLIAA